MIGGEKKENKMKKEKILKEYRLDIPTNEHFKLDIKVEIFEKKDRKVWVRIAATANNADIIAWSEWLY